MVTSTLAKKHPESQETADNQQRDLSIGCRPGNFLIPNKRSSRNDDDRDDNDNDNENGKMVYIIKTKRFFLNKDMSVSVVIAI